LVRLFSATAVVALLASLSTGCGSDDSKAAATVTEVRTVTAPPTSSSLSPAVTATSTTATASSVVPDDSSISTQDVVKALRADAAGREDLWYYATDAGVKCEAFPALGAGERSPSGYLLDDYANAGDPVATTPDGSAGARVFNGNSGAPDPRCLEAAQERLATLP
jgi:hypothetical protein